MKLRRILTALLVLIVVVFCGVPVAYVIGQLTTRVPPSQVINTANNICLDFTGNLGSEESLFMLTHFCNVSLKRNLYGVYDKDMYIDMQETMECPRVEVADKDSDGLIEIYLVQDWLCEQFAHPWGNDPTLLIFRIDADGKFHEVAKE